MKTGKLALIIVVIFMLAAFPFLVSSDAIAAKKKEVIHLSEAAMWPATHSNYQYTVEMFKAEIEKRTKGRVKITGYPVGTLLSGQEIYQGVVDGIVDIGSSYFGYSRGRFPLMEAIDLPLGCPSGVIATKVANAIFKKYRPKELSDTHVLFLHAHGPGILGTQEPVRKLEDLKGMKIRSTGVSAPIMKALGAVPVTMTQAESYDALQKGVVQGNFSPIEVFEEWRHGEHLNYVTLNYSSAYSGSFYVVMNLLKWNSLPNDIQKIMTEVSEELAEKKGQNWDDIDKHAFPWLKELGVEFIELSPEESLRWEKAVSPLIDKYIKEKEAMGIPAKDIIRDIQRLYEEYSN
jgi:TRAP-type transport system periplasmic protein